MSVHAARLLVFSTSASVLVLEILAGRLLAPYVGVTLEAFTGIIGTILAAIALGSWVGGRMADRRRPASLLGPLVVAGGLLTLLAPPIATLLGPSLRGTDPAGIVVLTALAFFAPAVVLSAVAPVIVKMQLDTLDRTGSVVGQFSAVGTFGALFGTFVTGFVLIAALPTRPIVFGLGVALVATGIALGIRASGYQQGRTLLSAVAGLALGAVTLAATGPCDVETTYSCADVRTDPERPTGRVLWLDTARHSYVDLVDPTYLEFRYIDVMAGVVTAWAPTDDARFLSIGGGGFTLPRWARDRYPDNHHTVLEVDGSLVEVARQQLDLAPGDVDRVLVGDARLTIGEVEGPVDVVLADAFGGFVVPWHLATREFLSGVRERMADDALFVMNVIDYAPHRFARAEVATVAELFANVAVLAPESYFEGAGGNYVVVASDGPLDLDALRRSVRERGGSEIVVHGAELARWIDGAGVLRDDFAPVDQLITRPSGGA